ncbi:hypothetical protein [Caldimonas tepidiphila]|uniref:hypothetical protein n=1 Tax=Caldimonas tepidiphila TaxID=2315841 RepID=UPI001F0BE0CB|nr:hypothetical protein [Caldimonas tepidiphila]
MANPLQASRPARCAGRSGARSLLAALALWPGLGVGLGAAAAQESCQRTVTADIVAIDQPLMYNRLGASNVNATVYALRRDVIHKDSRLPLTVDAAGAVPGEVELRPDRRPRPLVLRVRQGDCLTVNLQNLLTRHPNPFDVPKTTAAGAVTTVFIDEQPASRVVGFHAAGMQPVGGIDDAGAMVGRNHLAGGKGSRNEQTGSLAAPGETRSYRLYAEKEGVFVATSEGVTIGSDGNQGHLSTGLFGQVIVEPAGARIYRSQVNEEEMRMATRRRTELGQPVLDYEAVYPDIEVFRLEGKAGLPVLNMLRCATATSCEIVHSEIAAIVAGPNADGSFPPGTYPLESKNKRNPSLPNRLEPFRDFASLWHDEVATAQAFPGFFKDDPVMGHVLEGVRDAFMVNYGSAGVGAEIIANRLGVGPMHDCLSCSMEEFFLSAFAVGDPALLVDIPANFGLESLRPGQQPPQGALGPKAAYAIGASDPSNVHHSYIGDFVKFRNTHVGTEHHVFHLHNHQWLYNPNDDNSNYLDAQTLGPGSGYTYEINFGGSGNRNKSAGDAIYHCHFYPHFAQGMWAHWRNHDVFETGTRLKAPTGADGYHTEPWGLADTTPAAGARAYPDGEIAAGTPIPAVVPLPGKALPLMPGEVTVVPKFAADGTTVIGSNAKVLDRSRNPGFPFWVAGIEDVVGQRPPTPVLDMLDSAKAAALKASGNPLWANLDPKQADGFDGGLPRHALQGMAAGGKAVSVLNNLDFGKTVEKAKPVFYPEEGTDLEQLAMAFHAKRRHPSRKVGLDGNVSSADFVTNGAPPAVGAPFHEPCIDDAGTRLDSGVVGRFFSGESPSALSTRGSSHFSASNPRIYKGAAIQFDAVFNKAGYHYPQQRILTLWQDAAGVITKARPPEPLVMRLNTFDCAVFHHTNLAPAYYEMDDYQVRTPTDLIGQHMHLPKWDLTTADGAANGWNYEDGTASPGALRERIQAIRAYNGCQAEDARNGTPDCPVARPHPYFGKVAAGLGGRYPEEWLGARTTTQRWFSDPVVNTLGVDRGLGLAFTHDHFGPSTHQQTGLYGTVLAEPAGSRWVHNETGQPLGYNPTNGAPARTDTRLDGTSFSDGGPTSWQAAILPPSTAPGGSNVKAETVPAHREFFFEFSDFQHAYEKGVYVGAGPDGLPQPAQIVVDAFDPSRATAPALADSFRRAINPPARKQISPLYPDLVLEVAGGILPGCPSRPCPQAISVQDPGMMVVNYRQEPVGLRVFDPNKLGPDGKPGAQAEGVAGDLAYALSTKILAKDGTVKPIVRAIPEMNLGESLLGFWARPLQAASAIDPNDPFTPMMRSYTGDIVRMKVQAGGHEEEHNASIHGIKWLQGGSAFGRAPNSGWRNAQATGISEQFTFAAPVIPVNKQVTTPGFKDYAYSLDTSTDGWWSGMWGLLRAYDAARSDLFALPSNPTPKSPRIENASEFVGVCPTSAPVVRQRVVAILANDLLADRRPAGVKLDFGSPAQHNGAPLNPNGGTLVYNPRATPNASGRSGPLHDPTAMLYVRIEDLEPRNPADRACQDSRNAPGVTKPACAVRLKPGLKVEPLMLRAAAGSCVELTLHNRLPAVAPDLPSLGTLLGLVKRDRDRADGSTPFDNNLIRPSTTVGLHPQLLALDVTQDDGANVGQNIAQTVAPVDPATGNAGDAQTYRWYAGDLSTRPAGSAVRMVATPVEFGGFGLLPADKIKQGQKSLVGGMVVVPQGATIAEDPDQRAQATVRWTDPATGAARSARDLMLVMAKNLNHRWADGSPVEHINGEGAGIPEDSQDGTAMAFNYGIEPLWFRFGLAPNADFGGAGCGPGCFGGVANAHQAYSNVLTGGADPVTPVLRAQAGDEVRLHVAAPHSASRGSTFSVQGHLWQRDPYVCPDQQLHGLLGVCPVAANAGLFDAAGNPLVGSRAIGQNPLGFVLGGQDSLTGASHFTFRLPSAGGRNKVAGDYLFRDKGSIGNASGLWGILRVDE